MLTLEEEERLRKRLLSILRQNGELFQLYYDTYGYTPIDPLLAYMRTLKGFAHVDRYDIQQVAEHDPRRQIEWDKGALLRATYGFLPTKNLNRLERSEPPEILFYGTHRKLVRQALEGGLLPIASEVVQLAVRPDAIGVPSDTLHLLAVKAHAASESGVRFFRANEWFYLCDAIPPNYVEDHLA